MATPTTKFFVRLANLEGYEDLILNKFHDVDSILCVEHYGEQEDPNPHFHFAITLKEPAKPDTFRRRLRSIFDKGKGNGHMSIKLWDGDIKPLSYMFHEKGAETPITLNIGHSDDMINQYIEENNEVQQRNMVKQRQTPFNRTLDWMIHQDSLNNHVSCYDVFCHYVEILLEKGMIYPGKHKMAQIIDTLFLSFKKRLNRDEAFSHHMDKLFSDLEV